MAKKNKGDGSMASSGAARINIGISDENRQTIAAGLSQLLADTFTLYLTTHNFHWNVTGPMFNSLHTMFMEQYTELWNAVDPIAERIRSLGVAAPGSYAQFGRTTTLKDAPADTAQGDGDGARAGRRPRGGGAHRARHLRGRRRGQRRADRRPADAAHRGARADGVDAALAAGGMTPRTARAANAAG